jgi:hypothetical protein
MKIGLIDTDAFVKASGVCFGAVLPVQRRSTNGRSWPHVRRSPFLRARVSTVVRLTEPVDPKNLRMRPPLLFRIINHFAEPPDASGSKSGYPATPFGLVAALSSGQG